MTGKEFRAIRKFNRIKQIELARLTDFKTNFIISDIENYETVPIKFVQLLSEVIKLDLTKEDNLKLALEGIPDKFYHKTVMKKRNNVFTNFFKI